MTRKLIWVAVVALGMAGCAKQKPAVVPFPAAVAGTVERGLASWYGHPYHGRKSASGEVYDMEKMVAAHKTLPFQTMVRVRNLGTNQTVDVRIIDRGPFVRGRIIDLSHKAAQDVGVFGPGVAEVELTILSSPGGAAQGAFGVQVGAFRDKANADRMAAAMKAAYGASRLTVREGEVPLWRVLAGTAASTAAAEDLAQKVRAEQKVPEAFVVRLDP